MCKRMRERRESPMVAGLRFVVSRVSSSILMHIKEIKNNSQQAVQHSGKEEQFQESIFGFDKMVLTINTYFTQNQI